MSYLINNNDVNIFTTQKLKNRFLFLYCDCEKLCCCAKELHYMTIRMVIHGYITSS